MTGTQHISHFLPWLLTSVVFNKVLEKKKSHLQCIAYESIIKYSKREGSGFLRSRSCHSWV